ncbi:hypothetical protein [Lacrimispora sp.]|uniref:hypothetical protein n=1 Tax=Lacrimispora sp. TaxID=2719234 RepID=UPI0034615BA8
MAEFIEINGDVFNIDKIQVIKCRDEKNCLGNDNGVYILEIHMEQGIGSTSKAYSLKKERDEDFQLAKGQLMKKRSVAKGYSCK